MTTSKIPEGVILFRKVTMTDVTTMVEAAANLTVYIEEHQRLARDSAAERARLLYDLYENGSWSVRELGAAVGISGPRAAIIIADERERRRNQASRQVMTASVSTRSSPDEA